MNVNAVFLKQRQSNQRYKKSFLHTINLKYIIFTKKYVKKKRMGAYFVVYAVLRFNMNLSIYIPTQLRSQLQIYLLLMRNNKSPLMNTLMISSHLNASLIRVKLLMPSNHRGNDPGIRPSLISPTSRVGRSFLPQASGSSKPSTMTRHRRSFIFFNASLQLPFTRKYI